MKSSVTSVIIVAAVVLVIVVGVLIRLDDPAAEAPPAMPNDPVAVAPDAARPAPEADAPGGNERLDALRKSFRQERRNAPEQVALATPRAGGVPRLPIDDGMPLDPSAEEELAQLEQTLLNDPDPEDRVDAVIFLSTLNHPDTLDAIVKGMSDPDAEVRLVVVETLGDYIDEIEPGTLFPALNDPDPEVRFEALGILGEMDDPRAIEAVHTAVDDMDEEVRALAEGIIEFAETEHMRQQGY